MSAIPFIGTWAGVVLVANATRYSSIGDLSYEGNTTETAVQIPIRTAGTFSRLYCRVTSNANTATSTLRVRKNTANGSQSVSITSSTTGEFQDTVNTDSVTAGDKFNYQTVTGATGSSLTIKVYGLVFAATANTSKHYVTTAGTLSVASTTSWSNWAGAQSWVTTTEGNAQFKSKTAGTLKNLAVTVTTNTRTTATSVGSRIGSANGTLVVSPAAAATGLFEDTTHTDAISSGSLIDYRVTTGTGTGNFALTSVSSEMSTTNGLQHMVLSDNAGQTTNINVTNFYTVGGNIANVATTTESDVQAQALTNILASFLACRVATNTITATSTLWLRKNGANGNQNVSIGSSITGYFEDTSNTDGLVATDEINYQLTAGSSGTSITLTSMGMLVDGTYTPPAGPSASGNFFAFF